MRRRERAPSRDGVSNDRPAPAGPLAPPYSDRERQLLDFIKELWTAYEAAVTSAGEKHDLLHRAVDEWGRTIEAWGRQAKGPAQLAALNRARRLVSRQREEALRPEVEARLAKGKSYQQIADVVGLSKSAVGRAVCRWRAEARKRPTHKAGTHG